MKKLTDQAKNIILLSAMILIVCVGALLVAVNLQTDPVKENLKTEQLIKVLFVIDDDNGNALTTNVLLYYPVSQKGAMFNIAGNLGAIYESISRTDRIDAVYKQLGVEAFNREIEDLLGIDIPFTVELSVSNLGKLTDLLGGIKLFVPSPVDVVKEDGTVWLLPSGAVNLDGDKIQTYMEYKLDDEEEEESLSRRQNILVAILAAIKDERNLVLNSKNFPVFQELFDSNLDRDGLKALFEQISNVDTELLSPKTIAGLTRKVGGQELVFPWYNGDTAKDVVNQTMNSLLSDSLVSQSQVYSISVQNGTTIQGLAKNTGIILMSAGYDVVETRNPDDDRTDYPHTMIIDWLGNEDGAKILADFLHCSYIRDESGDNRTSGTDNAAIVDFTLLLGADYDGRYVRGGYEPTEEELNSPIGSHPQTQPAQSTASE